MQTHQPHHTPNIASLLEKVVELGGSDLSIKAGSRPAVRVEGKLRWLDESAGELRVADTRALLYEILPESRIAEFEREHEADFAYTLRTPASARFRVNAFLQRGSVSIVFRLVPDNIRSLDELGLPDEVTRAVLHDNAARLLAL